MEETDKKVKMQVPHAFYNLFTVARKLGLPKTTVNHAYRSGNAVENIEEIKPIAHLFVCFEEDDVKSYAIRKKYFDKWQETGIVPRKPKGRGKKYENGVRNAVHINIPAPPFYQQFKAGIDRCNKNSIQQIRIQDIIWIAMQEYMDRRTEIFYPELSEENI